MSERISSKRSIVAISVVLIVVAGLVVWQTVVKDDSESGQSASYSGDAFSSGSDYSAITERNQEGYKVDGDGFIPISNDGGPLSLPVLDDESDDRAVEDAVCAAANELVNKRSRENRSEALNFMLMNSDKIAFDALRDAVQNVKSYQLDDDSIIAVLNVCA